MKKILISATCLPIGICIGFLLFTLIPMFFGLIGFPLSYFGMRLWPQLPPSVLVLWYWIAVFMFVVVLIMTGQTWILKPFADLDNFH